MYPIKIGAQPANSVPVHQQAGLVLSSYFHNEIYGYIQYDVTNKNMVGLAATIMIAISHKEDFELGMNGETKPMAFNPLNSGSLSYRKPGV